MTDTNDKTMIEASRKQAEHRPRHIGTVNVRYGREPRQPHQPSDYRSAGLTRRRFARPLPNPTVARQRDEHA